MPTEPNRAQRKVNPRRALVETKDKNCTERWRSMGLQAALGQLVRLSHQLLSGSATLTGDEFANFISITFSSDSR